MSRDPPAKQDIRELLIVSITPQNLERGVLWFAENLDSIKRARHTNPWWRENAVFLEKYLVIRLHEVLRRFTELGYERSISASGKGIFAVRGGIIEVWPINTEKPYLIEWSGNVISTIHERETQSTSIEAKPRYYRGFASIEKLTPGSYVVHVDHGIGIYRGQTRTSTSRTSTDKYYVIEYAAPAPGKEPDRLYVPVEANDRLSPYVGFETPRIHRLGGTVWQKTTRKIREDAQKMAQELLKLYQKRAAVERTPFTGDEILEKELRHTFIFTETPDQIKAEEEIFQDMARSRPMDRILCGDVGFGKTEVAIRAALRAIVSGKQVVVLAPTTVLAAQHERTFQERIGNQLPVTAAMLSRLTPRNGEKKILHGLAEGTLDCVIGTHRLLSSDVRFKNLGLVIIDEEQRFGVKQKEYFKNLRSGVDILSLSATPIPRTLSLTLAKLRDISRIETPPPERLPIATYILPYSLKTIRRAIQHELSRGGQIYFLHNRIETIEHAKETLQKSTLTLSYDRGSMLTIGIIHGRMREKEIIRVMDQFREKKIKILLATTIIENGLDISSANTLIVDDATRLGLAEAHQLRGRIGRGADKAHAYFLYKPQHLTDRATERLEALQEYSELGQGYEIALRDLEIRGAGNVLGREQSGSINKVGLNLYCQILAEAVEKSEK